MHAMLDIEAYGKGRDAAVKSVGACLFDPFSGRLGDGVDKPGYFHMHVNLVDSLHPGNLDAGTVEWWMRQSRESRRKLVDADSYVLLEVLAKFQAWCRNHDVTSLWSNGPTFDEIIMRDAFDRYGMSFPVHWCGSRCCRTLYWIARTKGWDPAEVRYLKGEHPKHDALSDAFRQAKGVIYMLRFVGIEVAVPRVGNET